MFDNQDIDAKSLDPEVSLREKNEAMKLQDISEVLPNFEEPTKFEPAWWLSSPHLQCMWPYYFRKRMPLKKRHERFELIDRDFIDAVWVGEDFGPTVIILHGLEGSIDSVYANAMLHAIVENGWRGLFLHFRNCSPERNRLDRYYHIGDTGDLMNVLSIIRGREPYVPMAAVGYSLGANVLIKWLGEMRQSCPLVAGVSISNPFKLDIAVDLLKKNGFSRFYEKRLLKYMRKAIMKKFHDRKNPPIDIQKIYKCDGFRSFDALVTAPLHGFDNVDDYYAQSSSASFLCHITKPTLVINALDDPLVPMAALPKLEEFPSSAQVELYQKGGHIGFVSGHKPGFAEYWLEKRIVAFLKPIFWSCMQQQDPIFR